MSYQNVKGGFMKKIILSVLAIMFFVGAVNAEVKFSFKASGGIAYIANSDWNDGSIGMNGQWNDAMENVSGTFSTFNLGMNLAGEFLVIHNTRFGIGFGAGFFKMSVSDDVQYLNPTKGIQYDYVRNPQISVIPLFLNLHYRTPIAPAMHFTASAGIGYYLGKFTKNDTHTYATGIDVEKFSATNNALGFQGSIGFEYNLGQKLFLTADAGYRIAKMSEVTGNYTQTQTGQSVINETRTMWFFDLYIPKSGNTYKRTDFSATAPSGNNYTNVRKAKIDLSGYSVMIGLRYVF
jgi:hypothetical protein